MSATALVNAIDKYLDIKDITVDTARKYAGILQAFDDVFEELKNFANSISSGGGSGDVSGPSSALDNDLVLFDGTTGKLIKDSGKTISDIENDAFLFSLIV
jgi:hypothetical protein